MWFPPPPRSKEAIHWFNFNWTHFLSPSIVRSLFCNGSQNGLSSLSHSITPLSQKDRQRRRGERGEVEGLIDENLPPSSSLCLLFLPHFQYDPHPTGFKRTPPPTPPYTGAFWLKFIGKFIEKWMREAAQYWLWEENTTHLEWGGKRGRNLAVIDLSPVHVLIFILQY